MSKDVQPAEAPGEEQGFRQNSGNDRPGECAGAAFKNISRDKCDEWIGQQEATGDASEQLAYPSGSSGTEYR